MGFDFHGIVPEYVVTVDVPTVHGVQKVGGDWTTYQDVIDTVSRRTQSVLPFLEYSTNEINCIMRYLLLGGLLSGEYEGSWVLL